MSDSGAWRRRHQPHAQPSRRSSCAIAPAGLDDTARSRQALARSLWRRLSLTMGVELRIASTVDMPSRAALRELDDWCQRHLAPPHHHVDDKDRD